MKTILLAVAFLTASGISSAQTGKKDTAVKPARPTVTINRFDPPRIVKDSPSKGSKPMKRKPVPPPPPPPKVVPEDSGNNN